MIMDKDNIMSDNQATVTSQANASTSYIDLGVGGLKSSDVTVVVQVATKCTSTGSATLACKVQCDSDAAFGSPLDLFSGSAVAVASLVAGYQLASVKLPPTCERYVRCLYTVAVADISEGGIDAFAVVDTQTNKNKLTT
jgi:hypothetical protein